MAFSYIPHVRLAGISASVPRKAFENKDFNGFSTAEAEKFMHTTGVFRKRIAGDELCTSDLCFYAAEKLINDLNWSIADIDCLIFVTQTPDYVLPETSCLLQSRLGLKEDVFALDISLGCSGWVFGLKVLASLLSHGNMKKGLLLVGDTISKVCSWHDNTTAPLFGDAGTATALEYSLADEGFRFHTAADGSGYKAIIIPDGGNRNPSSPESFKYHKDESGSKRNRVQLSLDGMNVFSFGISKAPESVKLISEHFSIDLQDVDYFVFHQANLFMNEKIRKKLKIPEEKVPYSLNNFGNTSSATIPLTMVTELKDQLKTKSNKIIACGFGVGLSWGSVYFEADNIVCSELVEI